MALPQERDESIEVKVRVYAGLRRHLRDLPIGQSLAVRIRPQATIAELLEQMGISPTEVKSCFVNGIRQELDCPLREGDELAAFPPVAGGAPRTALYRRPM